MKRLLLVSPLLALAALVTPAHADPSICTLRGCVTQVGEAVCGQDGCGPVARCHYWTDYPFCIY